MNSPAHAGALGALLAAAVAALSACQTTPVDNAELLSARSAVAQARANPVAARTAAPELDRAQRALALAESAWADRHDDEETRHLAYIAHRRADVVLAMASQAQADERLQQAGTERERVRLEARTREAEAAEATARAAQSSARLAQGQASASRQDADAARRLADQQAERAAALERDLQSLRGRSTDRGMVVTLGDVLFASGRATLQPGAQRTVNQLARVLQQYPERRVLVEGFTDSQGSEEANLELSRRRAEAFGQALQDAGVPADRIELRAHGEAFPVADNATAAGRQQNRRVEVLFSDAQGHLAAQR
jgi:outer membrane protein OmpA-like peptidoglycan-associated protein